MPKEIRDYQESIFFGLSTRQFLCSLLAVGVAVGIYFGLRPFVGSEEVGWMCILGAAPFAACGFFKYHGMTAEKLAWACTQRSWCFNPTASTTRQWRKPLRRERSLPASAKTAGPSHQLGKNRGNKAWS